MNPWQPEPFLDTYEISSLSHEPATEIYMYIEIHVIPVAFLDMVAKWAS